MDKKTKGTVAEMYVAAHLIENGWRVAFPIGENQQYDLIAEKEGRFVRIQVKYADPRKGALIVNCRSSNNWSVLHYTKKEIDVIAAFNPQNKQIYFIPVKKINHSALNLRVDPLRNNQKLNIHLAENFKDINF